MLRAIVTACILTVLLAACDMGSQRRLDRETFERESRKREPRKIKEAEIVAAAMAQGDTIQQLLQSNSQFDTLACCPRVPASLIDSLERHYQARIACYSLLEELPATTDPLERELLEAYQYNLEQRQPLVKNIQAQKKESFFYTAPAANGNTARNSCGLWSIRLSRKHVVLRM